MSGAVQAVIAAVGGGGGGGGGPTGTVAAVATQAGEVNGDAVTTISRAYTTNVTSGNLAVAMVIRYHGSSDTLAVGDITQASGTATITDPLLHVSHQLDTGSSEFMSVGIWSARITGSGTLTLQTTGAPAGSYLTFITDEYSSSTGWDASRLDGSTRTAGSATDNQTSASLGSLTTTGSGVMFGLLGVNTGSAGFTMTEDGAFTSIAAEPDGSNHIVGEGIRRIVTSGTTDTPEWTALGATSFGWIGVACALKPAA